MVSGTLSLKLGELQRFPISLQPLNTGLKITEIAEALGGDCAGEFRVNSGLLSSKL
jgi:hypothetical protein